MCAAGPGHVTVVVPTYDEAANIVTLLRGVREALPGAHVLVVDDGKPVGVLTRADLLGFLAG